ncbi:MAG: hypothetical protein KC413_19975 [Anaerolineales bacterium]|nr:hypothetical protein [Anaerolineales bacterium]MCA9978054.1 hypothetical protein [Anaerolineales bacterium]
MSDPSDTPPPNPGQMLVDSLMRLLDMLYPGQLPLDIITLQDIKLRYRLTGMGAPAMRAMEQAQRIMRAIGNYQHIGLCEFHIGLIYLFYQDFHGAVEQFAEARRQWSFVNETAPVCLAYYAEGRAQELALHYEAAMACYGKVEQCLPRVQLGLAQESLRRFTKALTTEVTQAQTDLRELLRQAFPDLPDDDEGNVKRNGRTIIPPPALTPIPTGDVYQWYQVTGRGGDFLQTIPTDSWLLVDTSVRAFQHGELVIIGSNSSNLTGSIPVRPYTQLATFPRTYLGRLHERANSDEGPFVRNVETGEVQFRFPNEDNQVTAVLGLVVGYWLHTKK